MGWALEGGIFQAILRYPPQRRGNPCGRRGVRGGRETESGPPGKDSRRHERARCGMLFSAGRDWCLSILDAPGAAAPFSLFGSNRFHGSGERNHPDRKGRKWMPTSSQPQTSAIHQVLIDSGADPKLIHPAVEEMRNLSGQNVTTTIGAQITELRSDVRTQITELRSDVRTQITEIRTEMQARIDGARTEMQAQVNDLQTEMQAQINDLQTEMQAQINDLRTEMQAQINDLRTEMQAQINGLQVQITELRAEMQTQFAALRAEMNTLNKIIWTLMSLLAVPIFGLLYKILTS